MSEQYDRDNLLDRLSDTATLEQHYAHVKQRERLLLDRLLPVRSGDVVSVGAGWDVGRHLFPAPEFRLTAVDLNPDMVRSATLTGAADAAVEARAGELPFEAASFDVVLYRLVLHHVAYQQDLGPIFAEAARILRPGGVLIAVEPGVFHPVGAALTLANRLGAGEKIHGTRDDIPLSPLALRAHARQAGLVAQLHAITFSWRRLPRAVQRAVYPLDRLGSLPLLRNLGHHLLLLAHRPSIHSGG